MVSALWLSLALLTAQPDDRAAYETAKAQAGRDADAHVKLALWCEQHGMTAERLKHLASAVLLEPKNATARGLLGLVDFDGRWQSPDAVSARLHDDDEHKATFAEYTDRRAHTPGTADGQWKLVLWCEEHGLKAESLAHCAAVLRRDPNHEGARKRLGYKRHGQRWVTDAQLAAEHAEAEAQKKADRHWRPRLVKWRDALGDKHKHAAAEKSLSEVTDPRAVPVVWDVFAHGSEAQQSKAVQLFGQLDGAPASQALATLAVASPAPVVRSRATETLRARDPREFVGLLIGMVRDPIKYEIRPGKAPGQLGELFVEGKLANTRRVYQINQPAVAAMLAALPARLFSPSVPFEPYSAQNLWLASESPIIAAPLAAGPGARRAVTVAANSSAGAARRDLQIAAGLNAIQQTVNQVQQQFQNDLAAIEAANAAVQSINDVALPVLKDVTGQDLGESTDKWQTWWSDQRGLVYEPPPAEKPTIVQLVTNPDFVPPRPHGACFGIGTPVRTLEGTRPIESIRAGDQVLTQDVHTGKLAFEPVMAIFHNKPAPTLKITLSSESIVATGIHRFWKAGHGWVMARELKVGDPIRTVNGTVPVAAIEAAPTQPVFNLEVSSASSYFVGGQSVLVHDNSLVRPVPDPFDAAPTLLATAAAAH